MPERAQPVGPPASREEVLAWLDGGQLVDMAGRPLRMAACTRCGGAHLGGEPCYEEVRCPAADCRSVARKCRRPSEHESFSGWHKARHTAFEQECQRRIDARDDTLPARWP